MTRRPRLQWWAALLLACASAAPAAQAACTALQQINGNCPPPPQNWPTPAGLAAGHAAGDWYVDVSLPTASSDTIFRLLQKTAAGSTWGRVGEWQQGYTGQARAYVRLTGPNDRIALTSGLNELALQATWTPVPAPEATALLVRGLDLVNAAGTPQIWKGINYAPYVQYSNDPTAWHVRPNANLDYINNAHANSIRMFVSELYWLPYFDLYKADYAQVTAAVVDYATSIGLNVVLVLEDSGQNNPHFAFATDPKVRMRDASMPDDHAVDFWSDVARRFRSNPGVAFELFNEPKAGTGTANVKKWRDGGDVADANTGATHWHSPGMQLLADTIRAQGANNLIMVEPSSYNGATMSDTTVAPMQGTNLLYAFHAYNGSDETDRTQHPKHLDAMVGPYIDRNGAYRYASWMSEFGNNLVDAASITGTNQLTDDIDWVAKYGVGWSVFGWYFWTGSSDNWRLLTGNNFETAVPNNKGTSVLNKLP